MRLPSLPSSFNASSLSFGVRRSHASGADLVGLDIQPGLVAAVEARVNGSIIAERAATLPLPADTMRDGEVLDDEVLAETLKELFASSRLGRRVRVGVANQRTVLRTLELPPITDAKELAAAVTFQAQDQVPMPLNNAVLDFHPLGVVDTPAGARQRVVVVAAQKDMIERLLGAVRRAGLRPEGVDLSAFALIRALRDLNGAGDEGVLYAQVGGMTTIAIAEGPVCRFTRVSPIGLDSFAEQLADRAGIGVVEARDRLIAVGLAGLTGETAAREVLDTGVALLGDDLRTSIEFFTTQWAKPVREVVISGPAAAVPGFDRALERRVGVPVRLGVVPGGDAHALEEVAPWRVSVAAGLAVEEVAA
jgi:type IV pilus assembly protein PilM